MSTRAHTPAHNLEAPEWAVGRFGMGGARVRHRVVLVRHGESEVNATNGAEGVVVDPPLTRTGQRQARQVGAYLRRLGSGPTDLESSPLARAAATLAPTAAERIPSVTRQSTRNDLSERWLRDTVDVPLSGGRIWTRVRETEATFAARVAGVMARWCSTGTVDHRRCTVAFTHSLFIAEVVGGATPYRFHLANGSITVLDFDEHDRVHVHLVNHTAHLGFPTGHHTAFTTHPDDRICFGE